ncbi:SpcZ [Kitasatospora acidiphila]|uniref:SpcZ n=1 Tax=Kitasatospora acidiphila TaxID=2567942 RepID=A0A540VXA1_9ACTN|nr:SpcZ [Kitasatospora acidiphila]TQF01383.1 SpcZ [Kitasatospora acidiphila]
MTTPEAATERETFEAFLSSLGADGPAAGPEWLRSVGEALFEAMEADAGRDWVRRMHRELVRLDGEVPFSVVHDWHHLSVRPVLVEASERRGGVPARHLAVADLHERASNGERIGETAWTAALGPALRELYEYAYPYADAHAAAASAAGTYALANGYGEAEAAAYGASYAELNTEANARSHADSNALANAPAVARALAATDPVAYAATYPAARVRAVVRAYAEQDRTRTRDVGARLAEGLADSLARVAAA